MTLPLWLRQHHQLVRRAAKLIKWPSKKYLGKPSKFALEILGVRLTPKQEEILAALTKPNARVAVRSGHGVGKTFLGAIAALYWFACYPQARVIMSAPVLTQVEDLIWRTIKILHGASGVCYQCRVDAGKRGFRGKQCEHSTRLDGTPAQKAQSGLVVGYREIKGIVVVTVDTATGYGVGDPHQTDEAEGQDQLWIGDEASGLRDGWLTAAMAGCKRGGSILVIGNPTKNTGFHADAFRVVLKPGQVDFWTDRFTISCFDTPNVAEGRVVVPGLVTIEWVESCTNLWGTSSALYAIRILGIHPEHAKGMLVSYGDMHLAHARWSPPRGSALPAAPEGLEIGIDVAALNRRLKGATTGMTTTQLSSGVSGDKWVMCAKRGATVCEFQKYYTMSDDELEVRLLAMIAEWRAYPTERVTVRFDEEGRGGSEAAKILVRIRAAHPEVPFELEGVKASQKSTDERYGTVRDAMYASLAELICDELEIPPDDEVDDELTQYRWIEDPKWGREKLLDKDELKKLLNDHRSPDTGESLAITCWTGRVISHEDRELEGTPGYIEPWRDGLAVLPKHKRDPGVRGYRRGGM